MTTEFKAGDRVRIAQHWRNPDEPDIEYTIVEWDGGRGLISPVEWKHGPIVPQELVSDYMITK